MLWFALAVMTGLAVLAALWPLAFRRASSSAAADEAEFHKAQLAEIDRDIERGQLPQQEAAAARAEAARRLIAASAPVAETGPVAGATARRRVAAALILVATPLIALGGYYALGRPDLSDAPLAGRGVEPNSPDALAAAIAKIEARLVSHPDDARAWGVLAPVYMRLGRFDDAADAYRQLLRLKGEQASLRADLGEALVAIAGGVVDADARAEFDKAVADKPDEAKARFYLGLAAEQGGDAKKASETYEALRPLANGDEAWMIGLRARLSTLKGEPAPSAASPDAGQGFTDDQRKMIEGMVGGLASRLALGGGSADEWARLIRAYSVLHQPDKAEEALTSARKAYAGDSAALANFDALAHELGLGE